MGVVLRVILHAGFIGRLKFRKKNKIDWVCISICGFIHVSLHVYMHMYVCICQVTGVRVCQ